MRLPFYWMELLQRFLISLIRVFRCNQRQGYQSPETDTENGAIIVDGPGELNDFRSVVQIETGSNERLARHESKIDEDVINVYTHFERLQKLTQDIVFHLCTRTESTHDEENDPKQNDDENDAQSTSSQSSSSSASS